MPTTHLTRPLCWAAVGRKVAYYVLLGHTTGTDPGELEESHGRQSECFPGRGRRSHRKRARRRSQRGSGGALGGRQDHPHRGSPGGGPIAIAAHAKTDEDKLSVGLGRLAAEDPTLRIEQNQETHQVVLWCMGEAHAGVVLDTLANRYGVSVDTIELRVPLRETFAGNAKGHGRHIKQSGGHGQYGVCDIEVEPLPEGSGFEFLDKVVGGAVPRQFIPSVEKGVRAQMDKGVHAGYPVVDIRVTLLDGKAHSVDSSDFAFQMAGALALREAAAATKVILLEPIDEISVLVPDDFVGAVLGDLSSRRGRVLGTETAGHDRTVIKAEVPQVELTRYAIDLRSLAHGAASFTRSFARYEPMPESAAARVKAGAG